MMRIDVWSDIACPWCWLGKHHLEEALRQVGIEAQVEMRSYQLNPAAGPTRPVREYLEARYGGAMQVDAAHERLRAMGERARLAYDFARARFANTFDAHRLHHLARARGLGGALMERMMRAQHAEGADMADHATLRALAIETGLDPAEVDQVLASDAYADAVRAEMDAARRLGIQGVPFFVLDGRYGLSGAQPVEVFAQALAQAARESAAPPSE